MDEATQPARAMPRGLCLPGRQLRSRRAGDGGARRGAGTAVACTFAIVGLDYDSCELATTWRSRPARGPRHADLGAARRLGTTVTFVTLVHVRQAVAARAPGFTAVGA